MDGKDPTDSATGKVSVIFGTRPEAIKLAPVILKLKHRQQLRCQICVTAQHRHMLDQVLGAFDIVPDVDLDLMREDQSLADLTTRSLLALNEYLARERPDLVLIQGDTTSTLCVALAAFYQRIAVAHVEAGLRTRQKYIPFPEEMNRVLVSQLADLHFAPTEEARKNLLREGISSERIFLTGNTVVDALFLALEQVRMCPPPIPGLPEGVLKKWKDVPVILITGHRRESFGQGMESICQAILELAQSFPRAQFIYPVHLNPQVRGPVRRILIAAARENIHLIAPLPYLPFVAVMDRATLILTDSGGIQEEAPSLGKPVLVMREVTERPEGVAAGTVRMVGTDREKIVNEASRLLTDQAAYDAMALPHNPYGDGKAADRIVEAILSFLR